MEVLAESSANRHTHKGGGGSVGRRATGLVCAVTFGLVGANAYSQNHSMRTMALTILVVLIWLVVAIFPTWRIRARIKTEAPATRQEVDSD